MRLVCVDHNYFPGPDSTPGLPVIEGRPALAHDEQLDIGMPMQARSLAWRRIDEDQAGVDATVLFTHEFVGEQVAGKLTLSENSDPQSRRFHRRAIRPVVLCS
jgi:hypothetical protein